MPEKNRAAGRCCSIDCFRFVYALMVVGFHYYAVYTNGDTFHFLGGNVSVEFFLITASVFFFASFEKAEQQAQKIPGGGGYLFAG